MADYSEALLALYGPNSQALTGDKPTPASQLESPPEPKLKTEKVDTLSVGSTLDSALAPPDSKKLDPVKLDTYTDPAKLVQSDLAPEQTAPTQLDVYADPVAVVADLSSKTDPGFSLVPDWESDLTPEQAVEVDRLSKSTGLPAQVVETNLKDVRDQDKRSELEQILVSRPGLASYLLQNTLRLKKNDDDFKKLGEFELLWSQIKGGYRGLRTGQKEHDYVKAHEQLKDIDKLITQLEKTNPGAAEKLYAFKLEMQRRHRELFDEIKVRHAITAKTPQSPYLREITETQTFFEALGYWFRHPYAVTRDAIASSTAPTVISLVTGIAGGVLGGPYGFALGSGLGSYETNFAGKFSENLRKSGALFNNYEQLNAFLDKNPQAIADVVSKARKHSFSVAASDALSAFILTKPLAATRNANLFAQTGVQMFFGAGGEAFGQILTEGHLSQPGEVLLEGLIEGVFGGFEYGSVKGLQGLGFDMQYKVSDDPVLPKAYSQTKETVKNLVAGTKGFFFRDSSAHKKDQEAVNAKDDAETLDKAVNTAQESKLKKRDPQEFKDFVNHIVGKDDKSSVSVPIDNVVELFQSKPDLEDKIKTDDPAFYERINSQRVLGGDLHVDVEKYLNFFAEAHDILRADLHVGENRYSYNEGKKWAEQRINITQEQIQQALEDIRQTAVSKQDVVNIAEDVTRQLVNTGLFTLEDARVNATQLGLVFEQFGKNYGLDPLELYNKVGLRVVNQALNGVNLKQRNEVINSLRTYKPVTKRDTHGPTLTEHLVESGQFTRQGLGNLTKKNQKAVGEVVKLAKAAGFVPKNASAETVLKRIKQDLAGKTPVYSTRNRNRRLIRQDETQRALLDLIDREGVDINSDAELNALLDKVQTGQATVARDGITYNQDGELVLNDAFYRWFGDSKVVDADGKPLVVYHGTPAGGFSVFDPYSAGDNTGNVSDGFYFSNSRAIAATYSGANPYTDISEQPNLGALDGDGYAIEVDPVRGTYPVYLKMENPLEVDFEGRAWDGSLEGEYDGFPGIPDYENEAKQLGYDGLIIRNVIDEGKFGQGYALGDDATYVVFDPEQIKSVNNRGTFDPADPNIYNQRNRGSIQFPSAGIGNGPTLINLASATDLSTFLHESGHLYLELLRTIASAALPDNQVHQDLNEVKSWWSRNAEHITQLLNGRLTELARKQLQDAGGVDYVRTFIDQGFQAQTELDNHIVTELHEYFARGYEAYLFEGKAPTSALRDTFNRFRLWLLQVYHAITRLNVNLDNSIREVFDRMFAAQNEIEAARADNDIKPIFDTPEQAGVDANTWNEYRGAFDDMLEKAEIDLEQKVVSKIKSRKTHDNRNRAREIRTAVAADIDAKPVYQAAHYLTHGEALIPGVLPDDLPGIKLDAKATAQLYGPGTLNRLPGGRGPNKIYSDKATDKYQLWTPDEVADLFGIASGDELINDMLTLPSRREAIEAEVQRRLGVLIKDPAIDGSLANEALNALNDRKTRFIEAELKLLNKKAGREGSPGTLAKRLAEEHVASLKTYEVQRLGTFRNSELRAAKLAEEAALKGDFDTAVEHKQVQLIQHYIYAEARKASARVDSNLRFLRGFERQGTRKAIEISVMDQIDSVLNRYDLANVSQETLARRASIREFIANQDDLSPDMEFPEHVVNEALRRNWKELTVQEFNDVRDLVQVLATMGRNAKKLIAQERQVLFEDAKEELIAGVLDAYPRRADQPLNPEVLTLMQRVKAYGRALDASLLGIEQIVDWLDGARPDGPWRQYLFKPIADAEHRRNDLDGQITAQAIQILNKFTEGDPERLHKMHQIAGIPEPVPFVSVVAAALNASANRAKLLEGHGWTEQTLDNVLALMTKNDWDAVQELWDLINSLWPQIEEVEIRTTGLRPQKVEASPVQTPFGVYRGGYYPLVYDRRKSAAGLKQVDVELVETGYARGKVRDGFTKGRIENFAAPILLDLSVIPKHVGQVTQYLTHKEAVRDVNKILNDNEIYRTLSDRLGSEYAEQFRHWISAVARDSFISDPASGFVTSLLNGARRNVSIFTMGFKATTVIAQVMGLGPSFEIFTAPDSEGRTIGKAYLADAMRELAIRRGSVIEFATQMSGELRHRQQNIDRDLREQYNRIAGRTGSISTIQRLSMAAIGAMDMVIAVPTWMGAYKWAVDNAYDQATAVEFADSRVRLSQSTGAVKDLSAIQRSNAVVKALTMFYGYFRALYGRQRTLARDARDGAGFMNIFMRTMYLVILPAILSEILSGRSPTKQCGALSDNPGCWGKWASGKAATYPFASIPLVRDIVASLESGYTYKFSPLEGVGKSVVALSKSLIKFATEGETDKLGRNIARTAGYFLGLPIAQGEITGGYLWDLSSGKADLEFSRFLFREQR
jgi:hypothetical protein